MDIAHVKQLPDGTWAPPHYLSDHLNGTAERAEKFAEKFCSGKWGKAAGIGHDTGKSPAVWQQYLCRKSGYDEDAHLEGKPGTIDHSSPGAKLAVEMFGKGIGRILAYCIAGHHAGLPDWCPDEAGGQGALQFRLSNTKSDGISQELKPQLLAAKPDHPPWKFDQKSLDMSLWIRMLFSCLVDADFLDTEAYMDPEKADTRGGYLSIGELLERFNSFMSKKIALAEKTSVNMLRQSILADCKKAAAESPAIFSLTVPTGGGKTLSSLAFALEHAKKHGLDRVIYVIPYTSIIEQNADVFRQAVGADQVVEHHSSIDEDGATPKSRLAAENWDAPIIVTTSVQFFESLFAAKTSRCRKLHNIVNSVVVLDEAQLMPIDFLQPILQTLDLLFRRYRVTFVISTATQPAFETREGFKGLTADKIREIISDVPKLYRELKRVAVEIPEDWQDEMSWAEVAGQLTQFEQVLCVVSDRKSCRELHRLMSRNTVHLSALMCGQHRSDIIAAIKQKLADHQPVRVISTQLVEAGVDLDFPVVYRALAGLDSIAQAAGRCNREGKMSALGKVVVFRAPKKAPAGILRKAAQTTEMMLKTGIDDPLDHTNFERFFEDLYWKANFLDKKGIIALLKPDQSECGIQFRTAAEKFHIIDDAMQRTILVPYGEGKKLIEELQSIGPERWLLRKLQRYSVNIYTGDFSLLEARGSILNVCYGTNATGIYAVMNDVDYDPVLGLLVNDGPDNSEIFIQ